MEKKSKVLLLSAILISIAIAFSMVLTINFDDTSSLSPTPTSSINTIVGEHSNITPLASDRVDSIIDSLKTHDQYTLVTDYMKSNGLENQHFRSVGFEAVLKDSGMIEHIVIIPYVSVDTTVLNFGSVGVDETEAHGTIINVNGDDVSYTLIQVDDGKIVTSTHSFADVGGRDVQSNTPESEVATTIAKEAAKLFIADDYTLSNFEQSEIDEMYSFIDGVGMIGAHHSETPHSATE